MLKVHTSRPLADPDALDITRGNGDVGPPFAPSWAILRPAIAARREASEMVRRAPEGLRTREQAIAAAVESERRAWAVYERGFLAEMAHAPFAALLERERVVLTCLCARPLWWPASEPWAYCHRFLVASLLVERGAIDGGEIVPVPASQRGGGAAKVARGLFDPPALFLEGGPMRGRGTR